MTADELLKVNLVTLCQQHVTLPVRFFPEAGTFEVAKQDTGGDILEATRTLQELGRARKLS